MVRSLLPAHLRPGYDPFTVRRTAGVLLSLGLMELALWLYSCLTSFYGGPKVISLPVQAGLKLAATHHSLSTIISSPAGTYFTGTQGSLLYHATSLSDYFLYYSIGDLTFLDALFFAALGGYLHRVLRNLPLGHEFTPAASRAMSRLGLATMVMFVVKMVLTVTAGELFWARTHHLFRLATGHGGSSVYYCVFGLLLVLCGEFFRRGQQLQHENELTI